MAVRTHSRESVMIKDPASSAALSDEARQILDEFEMWDRFPNAGVDVLWTPAKKSKGMVAEARAILKQEPDVRFAGRVLVDPDSDAPVLYTENLFVKFQDEVKPSAGRALLKQYGLKVKYKIDYTRNAYFVAAEEGTGFEIFDVAQKLLNEPAVELCHPELLRRRRSRVAFVQQWHLKRTAVNNRTIDQSANVEAAWALSQGEGVTIAIIDDGVDIDHEEFRSAGKIVAPRDVTPQEQRPAPGQPRQPRHGLRRRRLRAMATSAPPASRPRRG